jgi:hypothetical protein
MKNIHVLPTDKPSRLYLFEERPILGDLVTVVFKNSGAVNQNIFITNNEQIKEGDAYITKHGEICKSHNGSKILLFKTDKKIILTTDPDLIKDGVQAIDDEFLEWFVKNSSCERVEVEKGCVLYDFKYKIIIPQEELHSMDDEVECNMCGGYMYLLPDNSIYVCTNSECTRCYEEDDEEPKQEKQETHEYSLLQHIKFCLECKNESQAIRLIEQYGFDKQEQDNKMYSEEEVEILLETLSKVLVYQGNDYRLPYYFEDEIKEVIEQFKKK